LDYLTTHTSLSPIRRGFAPGFVNYKKGALESQVIKVYQLLAHGPWFSPIALFVPASPSIGSRVGSMHGNYSYMSGQENNPLSMSDKYGDVKYDCRESPSKPVMDGLHTVPASCRTCYAWLTLFVVRP
jgi:hypothetical protein